MTEYQWKLIVEKAIVNKAYREAVMLVVHGGWTMRDASKIEGVGYSYLIQQVKKAKALAEWAHRIIDAGATNKVEV